MTAMAQIFAGGRADPLLLDELQTILDSKQVFDTFRYDVRAALTSVAHPATTGNQDITVSGVTWQPRAAYVVMGRFKTNGTLAVHETISIGYADAARQYCAFGRSTDNVATSSTTRGCLAGVARLVETDNTYLAEADFVSFIEGGIRLNWTAVDASNRWRLFVILLGGNDLRVRSDVFDLAGDGVAVDINDCGFKPNLVLMHHMGTTIPQDPVAGAHVYGRGAATRTLQHCDYHFFNHAQATATGRAGILTDSVICQRIGAGFFAQVSDFDGFGFSVTPTVVSGGITKSLAYMALGTGDVDFWLEQIDSPDTAASAWDINTVGFTPQLLLLHTNRVQTLASEITVDVSVMGFHASDGSNEASVCIADESGATTMNTGNLGDEKFLNIPELTIQSNTEYEAENVVFDSDGFSIAAADIATADATTHKWYAWAMERTL